MRLPPPIVYGLFLALVLLARATPPVEIRLRHGDDPRWSAPDWDDGDWEVVARVDGRSRPSLDVFPAQTGIYWVRYQVTQSTERRRGLEISTYLWPADEPGSPIDSVFLAVPAAYEFYWDGRMIGRSGTVGASRDAEVPGGLDNLMQIPEGLRGPGPHVVALRISSYHYNFPMNRFRLTPTMGNYAERLAYESRQSIVPLIGAVVAGLVAAACAALFWFVDHRRSLVICGALGGALALFFTLIAWRWLHSDPHTWLYLRYQAMLVTMAVIGLLLLWLLLEQFALPRWWVAGTVVVIAGVLAMPGFLQPKILWMGRGLLAYALLPAAWAAWRRRRGAWLGIAGGLLGLGSMQQAADMRAVLSPAFFLFFGALVALLFGAVGWQIRTDRQRAREAQLTAARMEIELLKKNLQPHFLLNTLTAVSEVIEQDPKGAVKFIDDLAAEFRSLALMSGERLVPLQRELELCRTHLQVVARRTGRRLHLQAEGAEPSTLVPPALFLTLIENGLVYQQADDGAAFRLLAQAAEDGVRFSFLSPGALRELSGRPAGGTGLRYVKARLEESFPGRWTLAQGAVQAGWETSIRWQAGPAAGGAA